MTMYRLLASYVSFVLFVLCVVTDATGWMPPTTRIYAFGIGALITGILLQRSSASIGYVAAFTTGVLFTLSYVVTGGGSMSDAYAVWTMLILGIFSVIRLVPELFRAMMRIRFSVEITPENWAKIVTPSEVLNRVGLGIGFIFLAMTVGYYITVISLNAPQEYREDVFILTTKRLIEGKPIFTHEAMPNFMNAYGIFYSVAVIPFAKIFGATYTVHKAVAFGILIIGLTWLFAISYRRSQNFAISLLGVTILLHHFAQNFFTNGPRPDTLGFVLFLVAVLLPWTKRFSTASLCFSIVASVAAFYTKIYFVFGFLFVFGYLVLTLKFLRAFLYAAGFALLFIGSAFVMNATYDFYFFNVLVTLLKIGYTWSHQMLQLRAYVYQNFSLFMLLLALVVSGFWIYSRSRNIKDVLNHLGKDALFLIYMLGATLGLVIMKLGGNAGNFLAYYFELISPFLYLVISVHSKKLQNTAIALLSLNCILLGISTNYFVDVRGIRSNWHQWQLFISQHNTIFNAPPFADIVYSNGGVVYDNGHTEYFHVSTPERASTLTGMANAQYGKYISEVEEHIRQKKFDLLLYWKPYNPGVPPYDGELRDLVEQTYTYSGQKEWKTMYGSTYFDIWISK